MNINNMVNSVKMLLFVYLGLNIKCKIINNMVRVKLESVIILLIRFNKCNGVVVR